MSDQAARALEIADREWHSWLSHRDALRYVREGVRDLRQALGQYQWCGAFTAYCYQAVHPAIRRALFPSVYRLRLLATYGRDTGLWQYSMANGQPIREYHAAHGGERFHSTDWQTAQPGDIVLVGKGTPKHIALVMSRGADSLQCESGNGWGTRGDGTLGAGVVHHSEKPEQVHHVIRLAPADFDHSLVFER
jgi:hypothetical protein